MKVIVLSYESRLLQLERLERWCCKATPYQQLRVTLPLGLLLGIAAALPTVLAPYQSPDEICRTITGEIKIQPGGWLLPSDFSACPAPSRNDLASYGVAYRTGLRFKSATNTKKNAPLHRTLTVLSLNPSPQTCIWLPVGNCVTGPRVGRLLLLSDEQRGIALILRSSVYTSAVKPPFPLIREVFASVRVRQSPISEILAPTARLVVPP